MRVSCGENSTKYIRKGRWLAPEYYADEMQNVSSAGFDRESEDLTGPGASLREGIKI